MGRRMMLPAWNDPLKHWEPTAGQRARAYELWLLRAEESVDLRDAFDSYNNDVLVEKNLPSVILAAIDYSLALLIGALGRDLALRQLRAHLEQARIEAAQAAIEEARHNDDD
jgi:hypothetical protein